MNRMRFTKSQSEAVAYRYVALMAALKKISDMDPEGIRADDLGRAARIAKDAMRDDVSAATERNDG